MPTVPVELTKQEADMLRDLILHQSSCGAAAFWDYFGIEIWTTWDDEEAPRDYGPHEIVLLRWKQSVQRKDGTNFPDFPDGVQAWLTQRGFVRYVDHKHGRPFYRRGPDFDADYRQDRPQLDSRSNFKHGYKQGELMKSRFFRVWRILNSVALLYGFLTPSLFTIEPFNKLSVFGILTDFAKDLQSFNLTSFIFFILPLLSLAFYILVNLIFAVTKVASNKHQRLREWLLVLMISGLAWFMLGSALADKISSWIALAGLVSSIVLEEVSSSALVTSSTAHTDSAEGSPRKGFRLVVSWAQFIIEYSIALIFTALVWGGYKGPSFLGITLSIFATIGLFSTIRRGIRIFFNGRVRYILLYATLFAGLWLYKWALNLVLPTTWVDYWWLPFLPLAVIVLEMPIIDLGLAKFMSQKSYLALVLAAISEMTLFYLIYAGFYGIFHPLTAVSFIKNKSLWNSLVLTLSILAIILTCLIVVVLLIPFLPLAVLLWTAVIYIMFLPLAVSRLFFEINFKDYTWDFGRVLLYIASRFIVILPDYHKISFVKIWLVDLMIKVAKVIAIPLWFEFERRRMGSGALLILQESMAISKRDGK